MFRFLVLCLNNFACLEINFVQNGTGITKNKIGRIAKRQDMQDDKFPHFQITETILGWCFDVMNELGAGFLESVYKNALFIAIREKGFKIEIEKGLK